MTNSKGIDPKKYYERRGRHSESTPLKTVVAELSTGNNQEVVAAVTGKSIRVMGFDAQSDTSTQGELEFIDGSGGSALYMSLYCPPSTSEPFQKLINDTGYFETTAGTGLFVDVVTAAINITVYYIEYTP